MRDVARSVSSLETGNFGNSPSMMILDRVITACSAAIQETDGLPPETVVHTLSALAKPLNKLGNGYKQQPSANECYLITKSLQALGTVCERLNSVFDSLPISQTLPVSRLAFMGTASLAPLFTSLAEISVRQSTMNDAEQNLMATFERALRLSLQCSMLYVAKIPELTAESSLDSTRYDIKGTMRGPGGEDHGEF